MAAAITILGCLAVAMAAGCWCHRLHLAEFAKIRRDIAALKVSQPLSTKPPTVSDLYPVKDLRCSESNTA